MRKLLIVLFSLLLIAFSIAFYEIFELRLYTGILWFISLVALAELIFFGKDDNNLFDD